MIILGKPKGQKFTPSVLRYGLVSASLMFAVATCGFAAEGANRRGEIGIQLGVRWVDRDIVPDDSNGLGFVYGVEGAWALDELRQSNAVFLVGWGVGVGSRH